ncbi:MAG: hypothetical protein JNK82_15235 [Myxococcaceae bacterium]|nr:hypothetical protein [Myxococcaceae bacterium]
MHRFAAVVLCAACSHLPLAGGGGGFPSVLSKPLPGSIAPGKKWSWPEPQAFDAAWQGRLEAGSSFTVLTGDLVALENQRYDAKSSELVDLPAPAWAQLDSAVARDPERGCRAPGLRLIDRRGRLEPVLESHSWCAGRAWKVVEAEPDTYLLEGAGYGKTVARFTVTSRLAAQAVPEHYLTDWTYAATLLAPQPEGAKLIAEYEQSAPMGRCSMDTAPARHAQQFAERCYRLGELACFLQLQLRVIGDQFNRVAWSSYGEASHPTHAGRLETTGIDVDRFLRGLVVQVPGDRPSELGPSRLARALIETGRREAFEATLVAMAQDPALDAFNRLRALQVYVSLHYRENGDDAGMKKKLGMLKLDALSTAWWAALGK